MNKVILMGRLTRDPEVRYSAGENALAIARYTLAVDRRFRRDGEATADFISCVVFGRGAEFAEKYFHQGIRIVVSGRIQTGSYTNRDGQKVYTTEVVVEEQEFAEREKEPATLADLGARVQRAQATIPFVLDGQVLAENLTTCGKDAAWLERTAQANSLLLECGHLRCEGCARCDREGEKQPFFLSGQPHPVH